MIATFLAVSLLAAQAPHPSVAPADATTHAAPRARVADLRWISGHWQNAEDGALSEEVWTEPRGDGMLGMWRYVAKDGRARVLEILAIADEETGPVLRLRHFDRGLVAREEKDKPVALALVSLDLPGRRAVFEGPSPEGMVRLRYHQPSADALEVTLEKPGRPPQPFVFQRRR